MFGVLPPAPHVLVCSEWAAAETTRVPRGALCVGVSLAVQRSRSVPCICTLSVFGSVSFGYIDLLVKPLREPLRLAI